MTRVLVFLAGAVLAAAIPLRLRSERRASGIGHPYCFVEHAQDIPNFSQPTGVAPAGGYCTTAKERFTANCNTVIGTTSKDVGKDCTRIYTAVTSCMEDPATCKDIIRSTIALQESIPRKFRKALVFSVGATAEAPKFVKSNLRIEVRTALSIPRGVGNPLPQLGRRACTPRPSNLPLRAGLRAGRHRHRQAAGGLGHDEAQQHRHGPRRVQQRLRVAARGGYPGVTRHRSGTPLDPQLQADPQNHPAARSRRPPLLQNAVAPWEQASYWLADTAQPGDEVFLLVKRVGGLRAFATVELAALANSFVKSIRVVVHKSTAFNPEGKRVYGRACDRVKEEFKSAGLNFEKDRTIEVQCHDGAGDDFEIGSADVTFNVSTRR